MADIIKKMMVKKIEQKAILSVVFLVFIFLFLNILYIYFVLIPHEQSLSLNLPHQIHLQDQKYHIKYCKLSNIRHYVFDAAIASQDRRFYSNWGIDLIGTARAIIMSVITGRRQGASTITEQLAKNAYFQDKDTLKTDIETKILSLFITNDFSKKYILEMYLNDIYFGKNAYGIYNASTIYFHTTPRSLSLDQAAYLVGIINAPSYFVSHSSDAISEADIILQQMYQNDYITYPQMIKAKNSLNTYIIKTIPS